MEPDMKEWSRQAAHYQELFRKVVTDEEFQAATKAILDKAKKESNVPAFIMICDRVMGKPASAPKPADDKPKPDELPNGLEIVVNGTDTPVENSAPRSTAGGPNPSIMAAALNSEPRVPAEPRASASSSNRSLTVAALNSEPRVSASG